MNRKKLGPSKRAGATTVEAAIALPILLLMIFAGWEFARVNMIRNTMDAAVYYAAREATLPGATVSKAFDRGTTELQNVGINGASFEFTPSVISDDTSEVVVDLTVPVSQNSFGVTQFLTGKNLASSCTLSRELQPGTF